MRHAGGASFPNVEQVVEVTGSRLGETAEQLVTIAEANGYTVVASGPNQFRLARSYRPRWATVVACVTAVFALLGLFFLLVRRTETGEVTISEDRTGIKCRLTGSVRPEMVAQLRERLSKPRPAQVPPALVSDAVSFQPMPPTMTSSMPPVGLIAAPLPQLLDGDGEQQTVVRPRATRPVLHLADGRAIPVGVGGIIGRAPSVDPALPGAQLHPCVDPSLSKTHLSFGPSDNGIWVMDHHSTNGTMVLANGAAHPCAPGVKTEVPFGAQVMAGDMNILVSDR